MEKIEKNPLEYSCTQKLMAKKVSNKIFLYDAMITIAADNKSQINFNGNERRSTRSAHDFYLFI